MSEEFPLYVHLGTRHPAVLEQSRQDAVRAEILKSPADVLERSRRAWKEALDARAQAYHALFTMYPDPSSYPLRLVETREPHVIERLAGQGYVPVMGDTKMSTFHDSRLN